MTIITSNTIKINIASDEYVVQSYNFKPIIERAQKYLHQIKANAY